MLGFEKKYVVIATSGIIFAVSIFSFLSNYNHAKKTSVGVYTVGKNETKTVKVVEERYIKLSDVQSINYIKNFPSFHEKFKLPILSIDENRGEIKSILDKINSSENIRQSTSGEKGSRQLGYPSELKIKLKDNSEISIVRCLKVTETDIKNPPRREVRGELYQDRFLMVQGNEKYFTLFSKDMAEYLKWLTTAIEWIQKE